jgi:hypothetical protein
VDVTHVIMTTGKITIKIDNMYEYALSEGYLMGLLLPNYEHIKTMTEQGFFEWLKEKMQTDFNQVESLSITFI